MKRVITLLFLFLWLFCFILNYAASEPQETTQVVSSKTQSSLKSSPSSSIFGRSLQFIIGTQLGDDDDNLTKCEKLGSKDIDLCEFVQSDATDCSQVGVLFDYLYFRYCVMNGNIGLTIIAYIILIVWVLLLISLLATTADVYFLPPLNFLAQKLQLSPAVAGITLLAIGNGAPDVFTAIAGVQGDEFKLVLGSLIGASICISAFIMGTVLLIEPDGGKSPDNMVRKNDFMRDIVVYILATVMIIAIAQDEKIYLWESIMFLVLYVLYVSIVIYCTRKQIHTDMEPISVATTYSSVDVRDLSAPSIYPNTADCEDLLQLGQNKASDFLEGLDWPEGTLWNKIQYILELPFSLLRWISIPSTDRKWGPRRRILSCLTPVPLMYLILLDSYGWDGFKITVDVSNFPLPVMLLAIGLPFTCIFFLTTNKLVRPAPVIENVFAFIAFCGSIVWLDILASEVVSLLQTIGIILDLSSAILGLTVLAIGNSIGDFVADTTVAKRGLPAMAVASCLGSPLLNDIVGLGIALTVATISMYPDPLTFELDIQVHVAWAFLGLTLISSLIYFPMSDFDPPARYGVYLIVVYIVFLIVSVVLEIIS